MTPLPLASLVDESTFLPVPATAEDPVTVDLTGRQITGATVVLEWIARAWLQRRGGNRLALNIGAGVLDLENATYDARVLEAVRVALVVAAKAAAIGYLASIDVTVTAADRKVTILGAVTLIDGSRHRLAVTLADGTAAVKFGGGT